MTIPLSSIKTELRTWIETGSGLATDRVIFAFENAPQQSGKYIHVWPTLSIRRSGAFDEIGDDVGEDDGLVRVKSYRHVTGYIQCFGPGANETLSAVQDALDRPGNYQAFVDADLAVTTFDIVDQTALKGRNYEERARMEFKIFCGSEVNDDVGWFNRVEISTTNLDFDTFIVE